MRKSKKNIFLLLEALLVIFLIQFPPDNPDALIYSVYNIVILVVYVVIVSIWRESIHQRVLHKMMVAHADGIVFFMMGWIIMRTLRYTVFYQVEPLERWCWYSYYIPMIMIPMFCFMSARCLGEPEDWKPEKKFYAMYIPALLMVVGVMTNDMHQLAFKIRQGSGLVAEVYGRGPIYFCITAWALVLSAAMMISLIRKCRIPGTKKILWLPLSAVMIGSVCALAYVANQTEGFIEFSIISYGVIITAWECCIWLGLIPSNTHYEEMLLATSISVQIIDQENNVCYASESSRQLSEDVMERAKKEMIELKDNYRLRSKPISGGHVLWTEDISAVNEILMELEEIGQNLEESNDLLSAEIALKQRKAKVDEKNNLYDRIAKRVERQLYYIRNLLQKMTPEDEIIEKEFAIISILGAYIKRQTNLILLKEQSDEIPSEELAYCIRESIECLKGCKICCSFNNSIFGKIEADVAILIYDVFERAIEKALDELFSLLINLTEEKGSVCLKMVLEDYRAILPEDYQKEEIEKYHGTLRVEEIDGAEYVMLCLPKGGEKYDDV